MDEPESNSPLSSFKMWVSQQSLKLCNPRQSSGTCPAATLPKPSVAIPASTMWRSVHSESRFKNSLSALQGHAWVMTAHDSFCMARGAGGTSLGNALQVALCHGQCKSNTNDNTPLSVPHLWVIIPQMDSMGTGLKHNCSLPTSFSTCAAWCHTNPPFRIDCNPSVPALCTQRT